MKATVDNWCRGLPISPQFCRNRNTVFEFLCTNADPNLFQSTSNFRKWVAFKPRRPQAVGLSFFGSGSRRRARFMNEMTMHEAAGLDRRIEGHWPGLASVLHPGMPWEMMLYGVFQDDTFNARPSRCCLTRGHVSVGRFPGTTGCHQTEQSE